MCARVWNKIFALYNVLKSHLSHKWTRRSFSERRDPHNDTNNMWNMLCHFGDKVMERTEISAFYLTSFALAGVKNLHLHKYSICHCNAHHDGVQNGARIKWTSPLVSDLRCAEFGGKRFVRARDTAANVMYYMMGEPGHSYVGPSGLPHTLHWSWNVRDCPEFGLAKTVLQRI